MRRVPELVVGAGTIGIAELTAVARARRQVRLDPAAIPRLERGRAALDELDRSGQAVYGVTTGVG